VGAVSTHGHCSGPAICLQSELTGGRAGRK
jgi:hypothetical protein